MRLAELGYKSFRSGRGSSSASRALPALPGALRFVRFSDICKAACGWILRCNLAEGDI